MKYLCLADLHLTAYKPDCRLQDEDWIQVLYDKFDTIIHYASKVDAVILAGDIFDLWGNVRFEYMNTIIRLFQKVKEATKQKKIYSIAGNHDCPNHSYDTNEISRSPYMTLVSVGIFHDLYLDPIDNFCTYLYTDTGKLETSNSPKICVAHKGLYKGKAGFPNAPKEGNVEHFLTLLPDSVEFVIAGDYHTPFLYEDEKRTVINCGSLFRRRADQIEYKPALWILDTDTREVEQIYFDIPNKIRRDYIDDIKEHRQELAEMIGNIDGDFEVKFNYRDNFIRMATDMENGSSMIALFNRMLVSNK